MSKYKPCAWKLNFDINGPLEIGEVKDTDGELVCQVYNISDVDKANAHLIVVSPELLDGLIEAVEKLEVTPQLGSLDGFGPLIRKLRALIIKATGDL